MIELSARDLAELLAGAFALGRISIAFRQKRLRKELWERMLRERIAEQNETWKIASEAYASGEPTTLDDLLQRAESDFELKSSPKRSGHS